MTRRYEKVSRTDTPLKRGPTDSRYRKWEFGVRSVFEDRLEQRRPGKTDFAFAMVPEYSRSSTFELIRRWDNYSPAGLTHESIHKLFAMA